MVDAVLLAGPGEAVTAGDPGSAAAAAVRLVGGDAADAGMEPYGDVVVWRI